MAASPHPVAEHLVRLGLDVTAARRIAESLPRSATTEELRERLAEDASTCRDLAVLYRRRSQLYAEAARRISPPTTTATTTRGPRP